MPVKTGTPKNIVEQAEGIASDAWERTGKIATDTAKTVVQDVASQASWESWLGLEETLSDEAVKAKKDEEFLRKLDGYKDIFRKIDAIEGRVTDEKVLDEKVRRYIEEEKKRAAEGLREMKTEHRTQAGQLGTPPHGEQQKTKEEQEAEVTEEDKKKQEAEKKAKLEKQVELPGKRKFNRRSNIAKGMRRLPSPETRSNRE